MGQLSSPKKRGGWLAYNPSVHLWADATVLGPERVNDSPQAEIDTTGHKSRRDSQAHNLHQETCLAPLVLPALDSPNVANDFENDSGKHCEVECDCTTSESIGYKETDEGDGEKSEEGRVGCKRYAVVIIRGGYWAMRIREGAVCEIIGRRVICASNEIHNGLNE